MSNNTIEKAFEVFSKVQRGAGQSEPDEVSFVGGFIACFGALTGRLNVGLKQDAPLDKVFDQIHTEIAAFARRVAENQHKQSKLGG